MLAEDNTSTTQETPTKPKRAASWVRKYYKTVDNQQVCLICNKTYGITTSTATTGRHLIRCHLDCLQESDWTAVGRQKTLEVELARMPGGAARILDSGSVDEAIIDWIEETGQSFTVVDCPFLKRVFLKLGYNLPDSTSIANMIDERRRRLSAEPLNLNNLNVDIPREDSESML